ncbi:hypothetical protein EUTSA_v10028278mg [Eutrema salsugineum]|uniref:Large ribosomal subunit protein uL15/eL18 domain-containing protein n=1 Tax=Eutrema salsugineum TaxID=72664 RepID=V4LXH1_EUTSA|nr:hypothetical protein EUTSA_v10028278mg [Eutrema salsugineum]
MSIDLIAGGKSKKIKKTATTYDDLYWLMVRRKQSKSNAVILKRLFMSKFNKASPLSRLVEFMTGKKKKLARE